MTAPFHVVTTLRDADVTVAVAESLTGGLVCSALVEAPGASDVIRGAVVAYAPDLKASLLGVGDDHLAEHGTVSAGTAEQMARGVRELCGSDLGVATTGVAGPAESEGKPPGTVFIAVADADAAVSRELSLDGGRQEVRGATVDAVLDLLLERIDAGGKDS